MKKKLNDILACPMCKGKLELKVNEEKGDEIITGSLTCAKCDVTYPIKDAIPHLLPPEKK
ncbi:MAG: methytransferase partner Trm112 [Dehalococcoidales bacterium]|nr:methytransferase partner Trm112 [Dehalococcoidales bacterium]